MMVLCQALNLRRTMHCVVDRVLSAPRTPTATAISPWLNCKLRTDALYKAAGSMLFRILAKKLGTSADARAPSFLSATLPYSLCHSRVLTKMG